MTRLRDLLVRFRMPAVLLVLVVLVASLTRGMFLQPDNLINVARQIAFEALIAFGMTLVIVTGGIDLSVGSVVALAGVLAARVMIACAGAGEAVALPAGLLAGILAGGGCGLACGSIITRFALPPFLVTLAAMLVARGFAFIACGGVPLYDGLPPHLSWLGRGFALQPLLGRLLPVPVLLMLAGLVFFHLLLTRTVLGRSIVATGSNEEAARLAGIDPGRTRRAAYAATGILAGLVGVFHAGKLMSADPKTGDMWELDIIAAVVVGGTSLFGGRGSVPATLAGALVIGVLNNGLNLLHVEHFWQKVVLGLVILAAALLDAALSRVGGRRV